MEKVFLYIICVSALSSLSSLGKRQYHFIYDPKNWTEAQSYCRETYTDLVTVENSVVMSTLISMADIKQLGNYMDAWIGLFDDVNGWKWSFSQEAFYQGYGTGYKNWMSGNPSNSNPGEPCTEMFDNGGWNDIPCGVSNNPICSTVSGQSATFTFIGSEMTWTQAQTYCRTYYTDLASVRDVTENNNVRAIIPAGDVVWIGLFRNQWTWSDGDTSTYSYWAPGQPYGSNENCVVADFGNNGWWEDWGCGTAKASVCYYDPVPYSKLVVRIKLVRNSSLDLNDAAALEDLLKKLEQMVKDQGVEEEIKLSWRKQLDGKFFKEEKNI